MDTRYYVLLGSGDLPDVYFSVASGGVYSRWDPDTRAWVHVTDKDARDFYSAAVETGDDVVPMTPAEVARLH